MHFRIGPVVCSCPSLHDTWRCIQLAPSDKSQSAANLLAKASLDRLFPMRKRLIGAGRQQYQKHQKILKEALVRSQAGTKALELIMASKSEFR